MSDSEDEIIQYVPFSSFVNPSFWHSLTELKIDVYRLAESPKHVFGRFTYRSDVDAVLEVDGPSFNRVPNTEKYYQNVKGTLMNKNTVEEFKGIDKAELLTFIGHKIWTNIQKKEWIKDPASLISFIILSYGDLKKFKYYYWFAFPSPCQPTLRMVESCILTKEFNKKQINELTHGLKALDESQRCFSYVIMDRNRIIVEPLSYVLQSNVRIQNNLCMTDSYFAFLDPSNGVNPGWPLRLFLAALLHHSPGLARSDFKVIGMRCDAKGALDDSRVFTIRVPEDVMRPDEAGWVGWERNEKGNFGPRLSNMSASMDPICRADSSADMNIKLMKWRLAPDLDVEIIKETKCLLLGAGTLGCHVARNLLAWGFRNITFIDNGKVSFSNPARQVLYTFEDCLNGGKMKAKAAADNLKLILPTVNTFGIAAHIPMPGHPVGDSMKEETVRNVQLISDSIKTHDVIFLLLDTREARWLPTLIAAYHGKLVINAALGFDSYVVMRHGSGMAGYGEGSGLQDCPIKSRSLPGEVLGCYFCNDVTAPGNSQKDRTLDQQCTVTRPGVASIAGALAVEFLVGLLQHPLKQHAPAMCNLKSSMDIPSEIEGVLGAIPHSIRGFLHSYHTVLPTCIKFKQCIACSDTVLKAFRNEGIEFLMNAFNSGTYLEEITGLAELHLTAELTDVLLFGDDDDFDE